MKHSNGGPRATVLMDYVTQHVQKQVTFYGSNTKRDNSCSEPQQQSHKKEGDL